MKKIWKDILNYEKIYKISNFGEIYSIKNNMILKPVLKNGYSYVSLNKNGKCKTFRVHKLVAMAFIPNPNDLPCINHKDENKLNNRVDNLEWCTYKYNNNYGKKREEIYQMNINGEILRKWKNVKEASKTLKISESGIRKCINYDGKTSGGYKWKRVKFKEDKPLFEIDWDNY